MEWLIQALKAVRELRDRVDSLGRPIAVDEAETDVTRKKKAQSKAPKIAPIGPARAPEPPAPPPPPPPTALERRKPEPTRPRDRDRDRDRRAPAQGDSPVQEIALEGIDPHALEVTRRLRRFGHRAYLVGGCVRDLLLGLTPKDFDVATSARPEEVKALFRNSRIIGRRFRLVHVFFRGGKIIETSTFRANASAVEDEEGEGQDLLIRRDNVFGTEEEDARRRDFTINGLFYDTGTGRIIDHVGGLEDIQKRVLRMIGDPEIRLREDPIRILRAIRIAAKANVTIDPELQRAMTRHKADIARCAPARVLEETLRLLRIGHAEKIVWSMEETGVLEFLVPELNGYLDWPRNEEDDEGAELRANGAPVPARLFPGKTSRELFYAHLRALDRAIARGPVSDAVVLGAMLYAPMIDLQVEAERERRDKNRAVAEFLVTIGARLMLTRRISEHLRQIFTAQRHFARGPEKRQRRKPQLASLSRRAFFPDALALYEIHAAAVGLPAGELAQLRGGNGAPAGGRPQHAEPELPPGDDAEGGAPRRRRSRRRRGSRKRPNEAPAE